MRNLSNLNKWIVAFFSLLKCVFAKFFIFSFYTCTYFPSVNNVTRNVGKQEVSIKKKKIRPIVLHTRRYKYYFFIHDGTTV